MLSALAISFKIITSQTTYIACLNGTEIMHGKLKNCIIQLTKSRINANICKLSMYKRIDKLINQVGNYACALRKKKMGILYNVCRTD